MSHKVKCVDSGGGISKRKLGWLREREAEGLGVFNSGVFLFHRLPQSCTLAFADTPAPRGVSLADRLAAVPIWPEEIPSERVAPADLQGFLAYPQKSQISGSPIYRALSRKGSGLRDKGNA